MLVEWSVAIQRGKEWMKDPSTEVLYIDPAYGAVIKKGKSILSIRLQDQWAWVDFVLDTQK